MSEILWSKTIPLDNVDQKDGLVADEASTVPTPLFNYTIKKLTLQCVKDVEFVDDGHDGHEVTTIKLEALINIDAKLFVDYTMRSSFDIVVYYLSGTQIDNYATPNGQMFIGGNFPAGNKNIIARADNVKNYTSIIHGDLADKVRFNINARKILPVGNDEDGLDEPTTN